jgi:transglutaminase-like putative cysteine protease
MTFNTYFLVSSYAFVATSFLALALTNRIDPVTIVLYGAALAGSWYVERHTPERLITLRAARLLSVSYLPLLAVDAAFVSPIFLALTHFVLFLSAIKLLQAKKDADWVWIYMLAFFEMLLAASLTVGISFLVSLTLFLFFFVATLAAFEIRRTHREAEPLEEETHAVRGDRPRPLRRAWNLGTLAGGHLAFVALISIPIFLLMPRFSGGALGRSFTQAQHLTGFSDSVQLGEVGELKQSDTVVMHVALDRDPGRWLRWRGVALEHFDGTRWRDAGRRRWVMRNDHGNSTFVLPFDARLPDGGPPDPESFVTQAVILEGVTADTLFAASRAVTLQGRLSLRLDTERNLRGPMHPGRRLSYTVTSDVGRPSDEELAADRSAAYPAELADRNLQLPSLDPRVAELARSVTAGATTPFEKARRIELYLRNEYGYSLTLRRTDLEVDPVSDFLLNTRSGHCEYFASGMVVMLRGLGVPARIVNGFQMGEYNSLSGSYRVRQADAHSWVEVYFAGVNRWVEFDPTPPSGINTYGEGGIGAHVRQALDAMQVLWIQYVVGLDEEEQLSLMRAAQSRMLAARAWITSTLTDWRERGGEAAAAVMSSGAVTRQRAAVALAALALLGVLAFAAFALHNRGWSVGGFVFPVWRLHGLWRRPDASRAAAHFYDQMAAMLARHGVVRKPYETPREFALGTGLEEVRAITEFYHRARFGGASDPGAEREAAEALSRLAARLRRGAVRN